MKQLALALKNMPKQCLIGLLFAYLLYSFALVFFSYDGFPEMNQHNRFRPYLADKPLGDDAYYMLTVAWNLAAGRGIAYNYGELTSGTQPLVTFIYSAAAWLIQKTGGDKWVLARFALAISILNHAIFSGLLAMLASKIFNRSVYKEEYAALSFLLSLFNFHLYRIFLFGLETGFYLVGMVAVLLMSISFIEKGARSLKYFFLVGGAFGILALIRIDFLVIAFVAIAFWLFKERGAVWKEAFLALFIMGIFVLPWLLWSMAVGGSLIPSSGGAQVARDFFYGSAQRALRMLVAITDHATPWIYTGYKTPLVVLSVLSLVYFIAKAKVRGLFSREKILKEANPVVRHFAAFLFSGFLALILVYIVFFSSTYFYPRYSSYIVIFLIPLEAVILYHLFRPFPRMAKVFLWRGLPILFLFWSILSLHTGRVGNVHAISAGYLQRNFPPPVKIGAWQSGVIGFYNPNVKNLDGKINAKALRAGRKGLMEEYLEQERFDVLVDWPDLIYGNLSKTYLNANWTPCRKEIPNRLSLCFVRRTEGD